ncbi:MAG: tetratricopeptide repeat protein [Bacteroidota bacterium]
MMRRSQFYLFFLIATTLFSIWACSTQKNKFVNRNWHAMTTYYNILYHGNIEIDSALSTIKRQHHDHYFDILPIERMATVPDERVDTVPLNEYLGNAEMKATKGIQKHSMFMGGKEYNFQIDEAYLLLGKARYYDQRFIPAKDAFNYILNHYPDSEIITKAKIWMEKTNMQLDLEELAIENLYNIASKNQEMTQEDLAEIYSTIAQVHLNLDEKEKAIDPLRLAIENARNFDERARWTFIKGQLFDSIGNTDSANANFKKVIELKRRPPRDYMVHSMMEIFKNKDFKAQDSIYVNEYFTRIEENWENRNHLDYFYFEFAQHFLKIDSIDLAIANYNKSLRQNPKSDYLISRDYLNLADIYFDRTTYKTAEKYYDSTLNHLDDSKREFRLIRKKRDNLAEVIRFEDIKEETDSILTLVNMSEEDRLSYFQNHTDELRKEAEALFAEQERESRLANQAMPDFGSGGGMPGQAQEFYFYNQNQVQKGEKQFKSKWGDIELTDNWRFDSERSKNEEEEVEEETETDVYSDPRFDPQTYISQIPEDETVIDSLSEERNYAYFQLGVIYKEKFKEIELAIDHFTKLLDFNPVEKLVLPTKYNLYLIYRDLDDQENMKVWKDNIISNHPDSRYADILKNPRSLRDAENSPNKIYNRLYTKFKQQYLQEVIEECDFYAKEFTGTPLVPKFELLKALAIGRLNGLNAYKKALEKVALDYPQTSEGKKAQELYDKIAQKTTSKNFVSDEDQENFKLVYVFDNKEHTFDELKDFAESLMSQLEEIDYGYLKISVDVYSNDKTFLLIHGLTSKLGAEGLGEVLNNEELTLSDWEYFGISRKNYTILQIHKNLEKYIENQ